MSTNRFFVLFIVFCTLLLVPVSASAWQYANIYGGPEYSSSIRTGFLNPILPVIPGATVNINGTAVGRAIKYDDGTDQGNRGLRWDDSGLPATELGNLGAKFSERTSTIVFSINDVGTSVGYAEKFEDGVTQGYRAVRWHAGGTSATELGHLGTDSSGGTGAYAWAINNANTAVGYAHKFDGDNYQGTRAVRWSGGGTVATELGHLGTDFTGSTSAYANAISNSDTEVGWAIKHDNGNNRGTRAVRWGAGETIATELEHLGTDSSEIAVARAYAINDTDTAVGYANLYVSGVDRGTRAVRWDAGGTAATELGHLGTDLSGSTSAYAIAINTAGTAVGYARKYYSGIDQGERAVRWDAGGTVATELHGLGISFSGYSEAFASAINDAGITVGYVYKYNDVGVNLGKRAVYWGLDNAAFDLNSLIHPASGWLNLSEARGISNTGWVTGYGTYDPDGMGGNAPYTRMFLLNINDIVNVPEPTSLVLFGLSALGLGMVRFRWEV